METVKMNALAMPRTGEKWSDKFETSVEESTRWKIISCTYVLRNEMDRKINCIA